MSNKRKELLEDLILFNSKNIIALEQELSKFDWDCEEPLIELTANTVINVITKYIEGEISCEDIISWANTIELREDIGIEEKNKDKILEVIFQLANPDINTAINENIAMEFIAILKK